MKRLILMRHTKAREAGAGEADADRPLDPRGRRDALAIGQWLHRAGHAPDHALVSSATRTRETWAGLTEALGPVAMTPVPALFHAGPEAMRAALRAAPEVAVLLLLGHQPGIGETARRLLDRPPEAPGFARYPTGAATLIDLDLETWDQVAWGRGRLLDFRVPSEVEA